MDEQASIVVFERSGYVSFANCGLPYYVGGIITERDDLLLQTPQSLADRFALDVRVGHEVRSIDRDAKTVSVIDHATGRTFDEPYDHLILSTGAAPFVPDVPGRERALALRTVEDTDRLNAAIHPGMRTAVVIGGGFIGLEVAENLVHRGLDVTIVEFADQLLAPLDPEMAMLIEREVVDTDLEGAVLVDAFLQSARFLRCRLDRALVYDALAGYSVWDGSSLVEAEFNKAAGFTEADDELPAFFYEEALEPSNKVARFHAAEVNASVRRWWAQQQVA